MNEERHSEPFKSVEPPLTGQRYRRRQYGRHDTLTGVTWAAILIFAGAILLADNTGMLPRHDSAGAWDWIMLGAGGLLLINALIRAFSPDLRAPDAFWVIAAVILLALGGSAIFGVSITQWWPMILILFGLSALASSLRR